MQNTSILLKIAAAYFLALLPLQAFIQTQINENVKPKDQNSTAYHNFCGWHGNLQACSTIVSLEYLGLLFNPQTFYNLSMLLVLATSVNFYVIRKKRIENKKQTVKNAVQKVFFQMSGLARSVKPNESQQEQLDVICDMSDFQMLNEEQKHTVWTYRYSLMPKKQALVKFLLSTAWKNPSDRNEAIELMNNWSDIGIEEAVPLLSGFFCLNDLFSHMRVVKILSSEILDSFKKIRRFAIEFLISKASEDDLELIMLQLVQALRYDELNQTDNNSIGSKLMLSFIKQKSVNLSEYSLSRLLINLALSKKSKALFNSIHWLLHCEMCNEDNDAQIRDYYTQVYNKLMSEGQVSVPEFVQDINSAIDLRKRLVALSGYLQSRKDIKVDEKSKLLQEEIKGTNYNLTDFTTGMQLPHEPYTKIYSAIVEKCIVFKSATTPMRLVFNARKFPHDWKEGNQMPEITKYYTVVKSGDDMRQDQLVLQLVNVMDAMFKKIGIDFQFTCYNALACSNDDGIMAFVEGSKTVQQIQIDTGRDLSVYLKNLSDNPSEQIKIQQNYMESCAGYTVATYLLAIGDRHLENLMVGKDGHMFHIDFGFILGNNPPMKGNFSPQIRINDPMILGLGGQKSQNYQQFKLKCADAFLHLRKQRNYLMNLVLLMVDAQIPDLPSKTYTEVLSKMNLRFLPELTEDQARTRFMQIIDESVNHMTAEIMEIAHKVSVSMR